MPKFRFPTFGPAGLLPKPICSRVDFLFAGFSHDDFSELAHGPALQACWDLPGGTCETSCETGRSDSSPPEAVGSSPRLPYKTVRYEKAAQQNKGHAGVTPHGLCRDCPAPREDSVAASITANRRKRSSRRGGRTAGRAAFYPPATTCRERLPRR